MLMQLPDIGNITVNCSADPSQWIGCFQGNWGLIIGAIVLIVGAFLLLWLFKQIIANAVIGIIALLIIVFLLGIPIPLTPLVILVAILGGLGGVGALLIAVFFGWL